MRRDYAFAEGTYTTLPFSSLGTAAGFSVNSTRSPYMDFLTAFVPCDGVGLSFAPSATSVSEYVFMNYLGSTAANGRLLSGYGLLDISQSNEYLDLVGSISRGTGTGTDFSNAVTYTNDLLSRLNTDFPNVMWSVRGVPFNHYFLIPAAPTADNSPFGTGSYFHPMHGTGDVGRVYDWTNAPDNIAQFYRDRSNLVLDRLTSMKWICPSGLMFFDRSLPFFRENFDPETMYKANFECFSVAKAFADTSARELKVLPVCSPVYHVVTPHEAFDPLGGVGTGSSAGSAPTKVGQDMLMHGFLQPVKSARCDGFLTWNNVHSLCYLAQNDEGDITTLSRNFFGNRLYNNDVSGIDWSDSITKEQLILSVTDVLADMNRYFRTAVQFKQGESCCPVDPDPEQPDCTNCSCSPTNPSEVPCPPECCTLAEECRGVVCENCDCSGSQFYCRYDPSSLGGDGCPPQFIKVQGGNCSPCNLCCQEVGSLACKCCCAAYADGTQFSSIYSPNKAPDAGVDWRKLYSLPYGGAYGSNQISINKNTYFLIPSVVKAIDPLGLTGQTHYLNTTGSIE